MLVLRLYNFLLLLILIVSNFPQCNIKVLGFLDAKCRYFENKVIRIQDGEYMVSLIKITKIQYDIERL
jgi:hypothetical protein